MLEARDHYVFHYRVVKHFRVVTNHRIAKNCRVVKKLLITTEKWENGKKYLKYHPKKTSYGDCCDYLIKYPITGLPK
jgi:hypothetical protein